MSRALAASSPGRPRLERPPRPVHRRLWHRLPWLALGLLGAMASAGIVAAFEELSRLVLLAFFIPAVVYMADAVGTQTEALVIRGISVGVPGRDIVFRELSTGLVIGILLGLSFFPFAYLVWGDARVAGTVALALLGSTATATLVAMALPYGINRLGRDPAFGAGPCDGDPGPALDPHLLRDRHRARGLVPDWPSVVVRSTVPRACGWRAFVPRRCSDQVTADGREIVMKKWFAYAGIAASVILVAFGIGAIVIGVDGYNTVRDEIAAQNITATDDAAELTDGQLQPGPGDQDRRGRERSRTSWSTTRSSRRRASGMPRWAAS